MNIEELNTVETSVETWQEFVEYSMNSEFYQQALDRVGPEKASAMTILHNYLLTFSAEEQAVIESDVHQFYKFAEGFIRELSPYRYNKNGYNNEVRSAFIGKIRQLLRRQKDEQGRVQYPKKYIFIRNIVKFCSSLNFIIRIHDEYKQFLFREMPQIQHQKNG
ncbi:MAG: hypothetical protein KDK39_07750 [Leptospiraceae bacterium]|nr:hypothetical protein [Leptospiraceae bacterium]